jgi:uncharacterized repeat protein (TIGR03803 family)
MKTKNVVCGLAMAVVLQFGVLAGSAQTGAVFTSLYSFSGTNDGASPQAGLVRGGDGNFYGTTPYGGSYGFGTIFEFSTTGGLTSLYSFTGTNDGAYPRAALVQGSDGNFYGTTGNGGTNGGNGTVFQFSTNRSLTSLYSFTGGTDGASPVASLVQGSDGNFYGTTIGGGTNGFGTVFQLGTNGSFTSLYSFMGGSDGAYPANTLVQGRDGNFYGTTKGHGPFFYPCAVFKISTNGALVSLYTFSPPWFENPSSLVQGSDGNFYGTTGSGGTNNLGTVFRLTVKPPLTMTVSGANVMLSWPTNYGMGWFLQKTVDLGAAGFVSITLLQPPVIINGQFVVTLPITDPQKFYYRLSSP